MDARPHGEVGDEGVEEDVLAVEQLVHFGTDFRGLDVRVVLKNCTVQSSYTGCNTQMERN